MDNRLLQRVPQRLNPNQYLNINRLVRHNDFVFEVRFRPLNANISPTIEELIIHLAALVQLATDTLNTLGPNDYVMTAIIQTQDVMNLLGFPIGAERAVERIVDYLPRLRQHQQNPQGPAPQIDGRTNYDQWQITRRYFNLDDVRNQLLRSISSAMENLLTSDREVDWYEVTFELRFDRRHRIANGKMPKWVKNTISNNETTRGLAPYKVFDGKCGFQSIVYALASQRLLSDQWTGDFEWFLGEFKHMQPNTRDLLRSRTRFDKLCRKLATEIGMDIRRPWNISLLDDSSVQQFVMAQPCYQVAIFNEVTRQLLDVRRGVNFDVVMAEHSTILLSYTLGHLHLITCPNSYMGTSGSQKFCYNCLKHHPHEDHICLDFDQCDKCYTKFQNESHRREHCDMENNGVECPRCNKRFYNDRCLESHNCRAQHIDLCEKCNKKIYRYEGPHECGNYICRNCRVYVDSSHYCTITKLNEPDPLTAAEAGKNYYAFDIECMLIANEDNQSTRHEVNLVVIRQCFTNNDWILKSLDELVLWMEGCESPVTLFAHNLKGYDGRIVFDFLFDKHKPPQEVVWRGSKIMKMQYGKVSFQDTLLHVAASLEQMPAMFGLDETQFKKGFFPYKFNTPENQSYVGTIPDRSYFEPHRMKPKKRKEFEEWYASQGSSVYDFQKELIEYCQSDVRILARSIEAYMEQQIGNHKLNPFDSLSIASYAMNVYRTLFMPENEIGLLNKMEIAEIAPAMHGGRTDTRRMLKEWTEAEVAHGIYGKYQDVQSLYPTVQFYDPLPVGKPRRWSYYSNNQPSESYLSKFFGFICCDIEPTKFLYHPILVEVKKETGRLVADLLPKKRIVIPSPEFHLARAHGYKVTHVYYIYDFDSSTELFRPYFRTFLKDKIEASGIPKWIKSNAEWDEFSRYHSENLGIDLKRENMKPNPSRKTGAKLLCNSLWGKFGERSQYYLWDRFLMGAEDDKILGMERKWIDGVIDITYRKFSGDNKAVGMIYKYAEGAEKKFRNGKTNIALAAMVTSHARCRLWKELHKLGDRVLYHDTDSIIYEHRPNEYNIPEGRYLGEWEDETDGRPIVKFVSTGPKCYSYGVLKSDNTIAESTKIKGITLTCENSDLINFESMKKIVTGELDSIETRILNFKYNRRLGELTTSDMIKQFIYTYEKGFVDRHNPNTDWKVYPFGYEKFIK
jgi:hypothetical protein